VNRSLQNMKLKRRHFIQKSLGATAALVTADTFANSKAILPLKKQKAIVLSTWRHGEAANQAAWEILKKGGTALDAVEQGVRVVESDPKSMSVGYGGRPDRDGKVTLDACIMDHLGNAGSVAFLQHIENPVSVARKVMEATPHVILVGDGALQFALAQGFEKRNLLTEKAAKDWQQWMKDTSYKMPVNIENHDTIGTLVLDKQGNLSGACTTSGMAYKMHGRVGDSPIIGAGLFVDNEIGAATATGVGELVLKTLGSFLIVELMRQGQTPQKACETAVKRITAKYDCTDKQVAYLALDKNGNYGAAAIYKGFNYAITQKGKTDLVDCEVYQNK